MNPVEDHGDVISEAVAVPEVLKPSKPPTRKEWKEALRLYFTVRHPRVRGCGHRIDLNRDPRHDCPSCWFSYFKENGQITQTADECFVKEGKQVLERIRGKRFVRYFVRFMATLARFRNEQLEEDNAKNNTIGRQEILQINSNKISREN